MLKLGLLNPLQKPNKAKGPAENLRPIILLSVLRKTLAISMISRIWNRLEEIIIIDQAAYQQGRSTTEQVFTLKILCEKAITTQDYEIIVLMLDMSKAFDTVNRVKLLNQLKEILKDDEMRMMDLLITDVLINVRVGSEIGEDIYTNIGVCQGDCLSAIIFIVYLSQAIKPLPKNTSREDHQIIWSDLDWLIDKDKHKVELDPKYADDINFIRTDRSKIEMIKRVIPDMLREADLIENNDKREEYVISLYQEEKEKTWKKCKCLGTMLDTEEDINRRKSLALGAKTTLKRIFRSRRLNQCTKIRIFEAYISSIFLYNSELWTITIRLQKVIDSFQRRLLREILKIQWPKVITNERLYEKTKTIPWSKKIRKRRLNWFGHLLRLNINTPARKALNEFLKEDKKVQGGQKKTWLKIVLNDIRKNANLNLHRNDKTAIERLIIICSDRKLWKNIVKHMMLQSATDM